jgi:hypothetical protein
MGRRSAYLDQLGQQAWDNGPEFSGKMMLSWAHGNGTRAKGKNNRGRKQQ